MKYILAIMVFVLSVIVSYIGLSTGIAAQSSIHEIEALLLLNIGGYLFVGSIIILIGIAIYSLLLERLENSKQMTKG